MSDRDERLREMRDQYADGDGITRAGLTVTDVRFLLSEVDRLERERDEARAACAVMREALESAHVDHWCAACSGGDQPCRALSTTAGRAEHNLKLTDAAGTFRALAALAAGRRK